MCSNLSYHSFYLIYFLSFALLFHPKKYTAGSQSSKANFFTTVQNVVSDLTKITNQLNINNNNIPSTSPQEIQHNIVLRLQSPKLPALPPPTVIQKTQASEQLETPTEKKQIPEKIRKQKTPQSPQKAQLVSKEQKEQASIEPVPSPQAPLPDQPLQLALESRPMLMRMYAMALRKIACYFVCTAQARHPVLCLKSCFTCDCDSLEKGYHYILTFVYCFILF